MISQIQETVVETSEYAERLHLANRTCRNLNFTQELSQISFSPEIFSSLIVNEKYRFILCDVPKIASTTLKRGLLGLNDNLDEKYITNLTGPQVQLISSFVTLDHFTKEEIQKRIDSYYKFMFIREPLERLLSAYNHKFASPENTYFPKIFGRQIIRDHRKNASQESILRGDDVTLDEFIDYLLATESRGDILNPHWCHYYRLCHPCMIKYNFIGKYNNFMNDVDNVLEILHLKNRVKIQNLAKKTTRSVYQHMYANISSDKIHQLWQMYRVDYDMFGYPYPDLS